MKRQVSKMARAHDIYPKHMTVTDEGKALYMIWIRIRKDHIPILYSNLLFWH